MKKLIFILFYFCLNGQVFINSCYGQEYIIKFDTTYYLRGNEIQNDLIGKKKKKNSDSAIHVKLSENYPSQSMVFKTAKKWNYKRSLIGCGVAFIGGVANGYHETILNHYPQFKRVHPNANDEFWNPQISWLNKYEDFDKYGKREAYFGSTTFLAWTTDAYHLSSVISNTSIVGATCIITIGEKRKWWEYGIDIVAMSLARSSGFHLIYSKIYN